MRSCWVTEEPEAHPPPPPPRSPGSTPGDMADMETGIGDHTGDDRRYEGTKRLYHALHHVLNRQVRATEGLSNLSSFVCLRECALGGVSVTANF